MIENIQHLAAIKFLFTKDFRKAENFKEMRSVLGASALSNATVKKLDKRV